MEHNFVARIHETSTRRVLSLFLSHLSMSANESSHVSDILNYSKDATFLEVVRLFATEVSAEFVTELN